MLTDKKALFVQCLLANNFNATQAYIDAGYSPSGARTSAARLLADADIQALISAEMAGRVKRMSLDTDRVLLELMRVAYSDITSVMVQDENGELDFKPLAEWTDDERAAIGSLDISTQVLSMDGKTGISTLKRTRKVGRQDKVAALKLIMAHTGMLPTNGKVTFINDNRSQSIDFGALGLTRDDLFALAGIRRPE